MLEYQDAMDIIEVAVRKQLPEKVKVVYKCEADKSSIEFHCPVCESTILDSGFYCWRCGQHLDWKDITGTRSM